VVRRVPSLLFLGTKGGGSERFGERWTVARKRKDGNDEATSNKEVLIRKMKRRLCPMNGAAELKRERKRGWRKVGAEDEASTRKTRMD